MSNGFIPYLERTRRYYSTLGYPAYQWARHDHVPFATPSKPLADSRLVLITTAARFDARLGDQGAHAPYNAAAKFFEVYRMPVEPAPDLRISHLGYDRAHTSAEDPRSFLPLAALAQAVIDDTLGALANELVGLPTNRSQRQTLELDAPATLAACSDQHADLALLVPS